MPIATISVNFASLAEVQAGTATAKSINPSNLKSALQSAGSMYDISVNGLTLAAPLKVPLGTLGAPSITFTGDLNTGIYSPSPDTLGFVEGGNEAIRITNTGNVGINKTTGIDNALDVAGDVRANFFRGSGRLLTDILTLTGGNIVIPVGSTRDFKNIQSALNSLSSFAFDSTANVQIPLDDETFVTPNTINLSHPYGDRITIRGANTYTWRSINNGTNPIVSTDGVNVPTLSATITFDSVGGSIPAVNDYVTIDSISGRDVGWCHTVQDVSGYTITLAPSSFGGTQNNRSGNYLKIQPNDWALITRLSSFAGGPVTSAVIPITSIGPVGGITGSGGSSSVIGWYSLSLSGQSFSLGNDSRYIFVQIGTRDSNIGNRFTQALHPDGVRAVLSFNDATATNTYLNEGDFIHALGQFTHVYETSSTNRCIVFPPLYTNGAGNSGRSATISTNTPYLVKTPFEKYAGCHRVAAVAGNNVTLEMMSYGHITPTMAPNSTGITVYPLSGQRMPFYGINNFGYNISYVSPHGGNQGFTANRIFKTKIDCSSAATGLNFFTIINAALNLLDNMVIVRETAATGYFSAFYVDNARLTLGNIGIWGNFDYACLARNNTFLNLGRFYATQVLRNYNSWTLSSPFNSYFSQAEYFFVTADASSTLQASTLAMRAFGPYIQGRSAANKSAFFNVTLPDCINPRLLFCALYGCTIYSGLQWINGISGAFFPTNYNYICTSGTFFHKQFNNSYLGIHIGAYHGLMNTYFGNGRIDLGSNLGDDFNFQSGMLRFFNNRIQGSNPSYNVIYSITQIDSELVLDYNHRVFFGGTGGFTQRNNFVAFSENFVSLPTGGNNGQISFFFNSICAHINRLYNTTLYNNAQNENVNFFSSPVLNCTTIVGPTVLAAGLDTTTGNFYRDSITRL